MVQTVYGDSLRSEAALCPADCKMLPVVELAWAKAKLLGHDVVLEVFETGDPAVHQHWLKCRRCYWVLNFSRSGFFMGLTTHFCLSL